MRIERDRYQQALLTNAERFRYWCVKLLDIPYRWGEENLLGTDCSGTVCWPLLRMGYNIRTTAAGLYHKIFTTKSSYSDDTATQALFFRKGGAITHVAPFVGRGVVLNAGETVRQLTSAYLIRWFEDHEHAEALCRQLDWAAADGVSRMGQDCWDLDPMESVLRGDV